MYALTVALFFLAQPFWEAKPPEKWTNLELDRMRYNSPWALTVGPSPAVVVSLATAAPVEEADAEIRLRSKNPPREPDPDYAYFLTQNREDHFVLAIAFPRPARVG